MPKELPPQQKIKAYIDGQSSDMTMAELNTILVMSDAQAKFPNLSNEFARAAIDEMNAYLQRLGPFVGAEDAVRGQDMRKALQGMRLKQAFYMAAIVLSPQMRGLKENAIMRFRGYNLACFDRVAGMVTDMLGAHQASQMIPARMRSTPYVKLSEEYDMKNMNALIRQAMLLN